MGASEFSNVVMGKTMDEAFRKAVDNARYDYGHAGYTGTIAEKHGFQRFTVPQLPEGISIFDIASLNVWDDEPSFWRPPGRGGELPCPPELFKKLLPMLQVADDKWGDAVGIDITDTPEGQAHIDKEVENLRRMRENSGFYKDGVRISKVIPTDRSEFADKRVFWFFGLASS